MFRPKIRGSLLDALERMATESGRDANELLDELLVTATSSEAPPTPAATQATPPRARSTTAASRPTLADAPNDPSAPRLGESIAEAKRREAGEDPKAKAPDANASEQGDDAPPEKMRGEKPNPLSSIKRWASGKESLAAPSFLKGRDDADEEPGAEDERRAQLRRKYLPSGRPQQRG